MDILKKYIAILAMGTLMTGCYKDIDPDIISTPVLCMNSLISAGATFNVELSHTWRYSDGYPGSDFDIAVNDAVVQVFVDGRQVETLKHDNESAKGVYCSTYVPEPGDVIMLKAHSEAYGSASAEIKVPDYVPFDRVEWTAEAYDLQGFKSDDTGLFAMFGMTLGMKAYVTDPASTDNCFKLGWGTYSASYGNDKGYCKTSFSLPDFNYDAEPLFAEHVSVFESVLGSDSYGFTAFTDAQFSGQTYPLNLQFRRGIFSITISGFDEIDSLAEVVLSLDNISLSYYKWLIYTWQADDGMAGMLGDIGFAETLSGYSNVTTNAGIVAAKATSTYHVDLSGFVKEQIIKIYESD